MMNASVNCMWKDKQVFLISAFLLIAFSTSAQVQIKDDQGNVVSGTTITFCGTSSFDLVSSIPAVALQDTLIWTWTKISGSGSLSVNNTSLTQPTFTPTSTGLDYYSITISHNSNSTGATTASVNVAIAPNPVFPTIPSQLCENDGVQLLTNSLGPNQALTASAGTISGSGSNRFFDPQGIANNTNVTLTLTETFTIPNTSNTFTCSSTQSITIYTASNVTLNLGTTSFQKCSALTALSGGSPSGGTYSVVGYPNAVNSSGQIDPSQLPVGSHTVTYTYTNTSGCTSSNTQNITITGFNFSGASVNFAVSEVTTTGPSPILATSFNGITTYSICSGGANATFLLSPLAGLSNFANYSIDWGDGGAVQTGTYSSTNLITHQYNTAGLYTTTVQLSTSTGCSIDTTINLYFGSTQTLGLSTPGNTTVCLAPGQDSVYFDFEISNWQNDPDGISYTFNSNDGSSKPAVSPLINGGVSQFPFIIYNATTQKAYYRHYFQGSSCNYTSSLGGTTYNNTYSVSATKTAPCPGSQSTAAVGPIVISESPEANIVGDDSVCTSTNYLVQDLSGQGKMVVASGSDFTCDPTANGYWEVYDSQWNLLTLPNNKFSLNTGSSLGSGGIFPTVPAYWTSGSNNLNVQFLQSGTYNIVKHIGLTAFGGNTLCTLDIDTISVCVDTIAITEIAISIADTICIGTVTNSAVYQDSINCNSPSSYSLFVFDESNVLLFNSTSPTDTSFNWTPSLSGKMTLRYGVSNQCGNTFAYDTIIVMDEPDVYFPSNDSIFCQDTLLVNLGGFPFAVIPNSQYTAPDSVYYFITPQTGWTSLGTNQYGHDSIILWDSKNYTIHARAYNQCGSQFITTQIQLDSIPNPTFSLIDTAGCSPYQPVIDNLIHNPGKTHSWKILENNTLIYFDSLSTPSFPSFSTSTQIRTLTIWHIVETNNGCIDSTSIDIHIIPTPDADFAIVDTFCAPHTTSITNNSTGNGLTFDWSISTIGSFNSNATLLNISDTIPNLSFGSLQYPDLDQLYQLQLNVTSDSNCTDSFLDTLTLFARPQANFTLATDSACGPVTLSPSDISGAHTTINSWNWTVTFPDNSTLNSSSATPSFLIPKSTSNLQSYTISLIIEDARGCSDTTEQLFYIKPTPTADFLLDDSTCTGNNIIGLVSNSSLSNDSAKTNLTYNWSLDTNGTNLLVKTDSIKPNYLLTNNTNHTVFYTLSLTVTNAYGCDSTVIDSIAVYPDATALFNTLGPISDCAPFAIDTSVVKAIHFNHNNDYLWTITDEDFMVLDTMSGLDNINYTINNASDSIYIILQVNSAFGCEPSSDTLTVFTLPNPDPAWSLKDYFSCAPLTLDFDTIHADNSYDHEWFIIKQGDTLQSSFSRTPNFNSLTNTSNTHDSTYKITHVVKAGTCFDTLSHFITVIPIPDADFAIVDTFCAPHTTSITNNSTGNGLTFDWSISTIGSFNSNATLLNISDTIPNLSFGSLQYPDLDQLYQLQLNVTSDSNCTDSFLDTLTLFARPQANFTLATDSACGPVTLSPSDISGAHTTINSWNWTVTFPDNSTLNSSSATPSFLIPKSTSNLQSYTISLIIEDARGCSDTTEQLFYIKPTPTADFLLDDSTCTGNNIIGLVSNSSLSNDSAKTNLTYNWSLDTNGTNLLVKTDSIKPNYLLTNNTNHTVFYTLSLTVTNAYGCDSTVIDSIAVYPDATALFNTLGPISDCAPFAIDTSVVKAIHFNHNNDYLWTITDEDFMVLDTMSGLDNINYTINNASDSIYIILQVNSAFGCEPSSDTLTVFTLPNPDPAWSLKDYFSCAPLTLDFDTIHADNSYDHEWFIIKQGDTLQSSFSRTPNFNSLTNTSNTHDSTYKITHVVKAGTCFDTLSHFITVIPIPDADFAIVDTFCAPHTTSITNNSTGNGLTFDWSISTIGSFNSNATLLNISDTIPNLSFGSLQYPDLDQLYQLQLNVTSDSNCTDSFLDTLTLFARPQANFTLATDSACGPVTLSPSDISGAHTTINSWNWTVTFPDNSTLNSSSATPSFLIPKSTSNLQSYTISLIIEDARGCSDTTEQLFYIKPTPTADFLLDDSTCTGNNIIGLVSNSSLSNDSAKTNLTYNWSLDTNGTNLLVKTDSIKPNYLLTNNTNHTVFYTLSLTVTNAYGCDSTVIDSIAVYPDATALFNTLGPISDCAPFAIDTSVVKAIHFNHNNDYLWTITDEDFMVLDTMSGLDNINYTINNASDSIYIILQVNSAFGCEPSSDTLTVFTLPNPDPAFTLASDTGCTAFNPGLDTLAQSTGLHVWEIFDASSNLVGPVLTGTSPSFPTLLNPNSSGLTSYTIHHTVFATDSSSCDSAFIKTVYVQPLAVPSINSIATYCALDTINLSGTSTNNSNVSDWTWTVGTDTLNGQNVTYFNSTPGQYTISLTTATYNNCDTTVYDTLIIHSYPKAQIWIDECGLDTVCLNQSFTFYDSSITYPFGGNITQYAWDFDNDGSVDYTSSSASHSFSSTGIRQLKLTVTTQFGCIDDTIIDIYVNAPPSNTFGIVDSSICGPSTFAISVSDTGIIDSSYYELYVINSGSKTVIQSWNSTPQNLPVLQPNYMSDTTYLMSRSLHNCCGVNTEIDSIIVQTPPVADFIILPDSGCTPLNTVLQLDGFIKGQADSAYVDFGDGSTQSLTPTKISQGSGFVYQWGQVPHAFVYGGLQDTTYYVTLTVYNNCGDSSLTLPVYVQPNTVQAAFGMNKSSGCAPLTVNFTNYSYNATTAVWCFDWNQTTANCNGGGSVALNPTWTFTQSGTYTVALFVDNGCGYDTAFQTVTVFPSPTAIISSNNNVCANDSVNFISNSTTSAGFIAGHLWEFGNGDTSILQNVDYLYDTSGVYTVTLTVTSSTGCSDSTSTTIDIRPTPDVDFTTQNVCLNDTTFFENLTTLSNGQIIGNAWNFGDGNSSNAFEPYHIYNAPGTYQVTLTHTSDYGCVDSSQQIAIVHDLPQLSFNPSLINGDSCSVPQTYLFTNNSTNSIQYNWDFDYANNPGVNTSTLTNPTFNYTSAGIYTVALFAETAFGCIDSLFTNILVRDGVNARHIINPTEGCEPLDVSFADTSIYTSSLDTIVSVEWFFGNGSSFIQTTAPFIYNYRYDNYGTYVVYNVVTMASGCLDTSAQTTINVYPTPDADFTISQVNIDTRTFVNLTSFVDSSITYYWTFSDGQTSTDVSPTIRFEPSTSGLDSIKACLYVINSFGCADSICKSFWVWPTNLIVPNAFAPDLNYIGEDALFLPKGHSLKEYEIWIYDQWGSAVWYSNKIDPGIKSPAEGWDGKHMDSGEPLPMGVYAWRIRALFDNNEFWTGQDNTHGFQKAYGTLTLIR